MNHGLYEGDKCRECGGIMKYPKVENCSCHINPPCSACMNNLLTCCECGFEEEPIVSEEKYRMFCPGVTEIYHTRPSKELGNGKRIFDYDYDSRSGSTMVYKGRYKGDVTPDDIISAFGPGTFGHRGPYLSNGRFIYTKVTD